MGEPELTLELLRKHLREGKLVVRVTICDKPNKTAPYFVQIEMITTVNGTTDEGVWARYCDYRRDWMGRPLLSCDVRTLGEEIGGRSVKTDETIIANWREHMPIWLRDDRAQTVATYVTSTSSFVCQPITDPIVMMHFGSLRSKLCAHPHYLNMSESELHKAFILRLEGLLDSLKKEWAHRV